MKARSLMMIHNFPPAPSGGAELQAERLAGKLVELGHDIQVLTPWLIPTSIQEETSQGVQIHRVKFPLAYWGNVDVGPTFRYLVKQRSSYDILHAHLAYAHAVVAVVVARSFGKKCIIKIACAGKYGGLHTFSKFWGFSKALRILHMADAIIAVSDEVEKELLDYGFREEQIIRISNGVDTHVFQRKLQSPMSGKTRFILIGRRHPQKGIDIALHAARLLIKRGFKDRFEIKMYGSEYPEYDYYNEASVLGVSSAVDFLPFEDDILSIYQTAHCLLLPSRGEGLSNALLEAMAMELPTIATAISGSNEVVDDGLNGYLIPPDSSPALANAMEKIILQSDLATQLGQRAREKVLKNYSLDKIANQYSKLYEDLNKNI